MLNFILFGLAVIGMTHIVVDGVIFQPVRNLLKKILPNVIYKVFECYQCSGTWCGFLAGWFLVSHEWHVVFFCGCGGSFLAVLGAAILNYLEAQSLVSLKDDK